MYLSKLSSNVTFNNTLKITWNCKEKSSTRITVYVEVHLECSVHCEHQPIPNLQNSI